MSASWGSRIRAATFDVFDTVVTRRVIRPADVFLEIGEELARSHRLDAARFAEMRAAIELELRRAGNFAHEVQLRDICVALSTALGDVVSADALLATELDAERRNIVAIPSAFSRLAAARSQFGRVIFISDTYLPQDFLDGHLRALGLLKEGDRLYCSSSLGEMKSTGRLFGLVVRDLGIPAAAIEHGGDNPDSDIRRAREAGLQVRSLPEGLATRYEQMEANAEGALDLSRWSGLSRLSRLAAPDHLRDVERTIWETTADVSAPLIVAFVDWCLREARQAGLRRLYFLARDGHVMRQAAEVLLGDEPDIECRYLHVSRQALLLPSVDQHIERDLDWILAATQVLTPRIVLQRLALDPPPAPLAQALARSGFGEKYMDVQLTPERKQALGEALVSELIAPFILERAREMRRRTLGYLRQEGLFEPISYALVDVGWNGTLQRSISRMLDRADAEAPRAPIHGLYMGLRSRRRHRRDDVMRACFFDYEAGKSVDDVKHVVPLIELFCAAPHAGTEGYDDEAGRFVPRLRGFSPSASWPIAVQQQAVLHFAGAVRASPVARAELVRFTDKIISNLALFAAAPSHAEALAYGRYRDAEDQTEARDYALARAYGPRAAWRVRRGLHGHHHNEWKPASLLMTPSLLRRFAAPKAGAGEPADPVVDPGATLNSGFGSLEGPYSTPQLPRFRWIYGPHASLSIAPSAARRLSLSLSTLFPDQRVRLLAGERLLAEMAIPARAKAGNNDVTLTVDLPPDGQEQTLTLAFDVWLREGERPLAAILVKLALD